MRRSSGALIRRLNLAVSSCSQQQTAAAVRCQQEAGASHGAASDSHQILSGRPCNHVLEALGLRSLVSTPGHSKPSAIEGPQGPGAQTEASSGRGHAPFSKVHTVIVSSTWHPHFRASMHSRNESAEEQWLCRMCNPGRIDPGRARGFLKNFVPSSYILPVLSVWAKGVPPAGVFAVGGQPDDSPSG
eukprot:286205-Pelagomonas_calceolata.AAC.1